MTKGEQLVEMMKRERANRKPLFKGKLTMDNNGHAEIKFSRWTKHDKDRVYVSYGSKGHDAGYIDLTSDTPEYICDNDFDRNIVIDCVEQFITTYRFF